MDFYPAQAYANATYSGTKTKVVQSILWEGSKENHQSMGQEWTPPTLGSFRLTFMVLGFNPSSTPAARLSIACFLSNSLSLPRPLKHTDEDKYIRRNVYLKIVMVFGQTNISNSRLPMYSYQQTCCTQFFQIAFGGFRSQLWLLILNYPFSPHRQTPPGRYDDNT